MCIQNKKTPNIGKIEGFTLIEVLMASVILFASIATVSMIYSGAFISSERANQHVKLSSILPSLLANIRDDIRTEGNTLETQLTQKGQVWSIDYQWRANLVDQKSAPSKLDVDTGDYITPPLKYKLWQVNLETKYQSTVKEYQFYQVSWTDE